MPTKKELEAVRLVREVLMDPKVRRKLMKEMSKERGLKEPYRSRFDPESPEYVEGLDPYTGFCSMASDALRRILGGEADRKFRGYQLCRVKHGPDDLGHFYLRTPRGEYLDPTASQFKTPVPYAKGRGVGLPTTVKYPGTDVQIPTQAAQVILDAARARRVASRYIAKQAGLLKAPPKMVKEIAEWAVETIAEKLFADLMEELEWLEEGYDEALKEGDRREAEYNRKQIEKYDDVAAVLMRYARDPKAHPGKVTKKFKPNLSGWPYKVDKGSLPDLPVTVVLANKDWKYDYYSKAVYDFDNMLMAINASLVGIEDPKEVEEALKAIPKTIRHELQHYAQDIMSIGLPEGAKPGQPKPRVRDPGVRGPIGPYSLNDKEYHPLLTDEVESFVEAAQGLSRRDLNQAVKDWTAGRSRLPGYEGVNKRFWSELSRNRGKWQEATKTFYKEVMDALTSPRRVASSGHLKAEEYVGHRGYKGHMTRWEQGEIPTSEALKISPPKGYHGRRGWQMKGGERYFGSYREDDWNEFLDDVRRNGIKTRLWIQQDPGEEAQIMEGNHRVQAAAQLGLPTVPVTIKYYGLSEEEGLVAPRVRRTLTHQDPERKK